MNTANHLPSDFLATYKAIFQLPTQWGELDLAGHINNVVYLRYFESGRVAYLQAIAEHAKQIDYQQVGPVLASIEVQYKRPLFFPDQLSVGTRVSQMDTYSMIMEAAIWSQQQQCISTTARARIVFFNFAQKQKAPIPDTLVKAVEKLEGIQQLHTT